MPQLCNLRLLLFQSAAHFCFIMRNMNYNDLFNPLSKAIIDVSICNNFNGQGWNSKNILPPWNQFATKTLTYVLNENDLWNKISSHILWNVQKILCYNSRQHMFLFKIKVGVFYAYLIFNLYLLKIGISTFYRNICTWSLKIT